MWSYRARRRWDASYAVFAHTVELPGPRTLRVLECTGPRGAATLMLLHGLTLTAELNWGKVIDPLGQYFRVIALDLAGDGHRTIPDARFRLEDCADDAAALAEVLNIDRFIAAGYSMGGMVAQLLHQRHPSQLSGLVLCATAGNVHSPHMSDMFSVAMSTLRAMLEWLPAARLIGAEMLGDVLIGHIPDTATRRWAREQLRRTSLTSAISAMQSVSKFSSDDWIGQVRVPTAVVISTRDRIIPASAQRKLANAIPKAVVYEVKADHGFCVTSPTVFAHVLLAACRTVATLEDEHLRLS
jgi:3-oxoadipate enol-lactonase